MIELLLQKLSRVNSREEKFNLAREHLQLVALKILADAQAFQAIAFVGGTALRILYHLRRYSEDLDFSVTDPSKYDFGAYTAAVTRELELQNLAVELRMRTGAEAIESCMIHFTSVLQEAGIALARDQKLSIKWEIDANPPKGAVLATTIVNADYLFPVRHYDIPSLMARKLHAVMFRPFSKGRDYYDLFWYLSRKTRPNLALLSNAIEQTEKRRCDLDGDGWIALLLTKLENADFPKIRRDLEPIIQSADEVRLIDLQHFKGLLANY